MSKNEEEERRQGLKKFKNLRQERTIGEDFYAEEAAKKSNEVKSVWFCIILWEIGGLLLHTHTRAV
jgi:hypothetical protein